MLYRLATACVWRVQNAMIVILKWFMCRDQEKGVTVIVVHFRPLKHTGKRGVYPGAMGYSGQK